MQNSNSLNKRENLSRGLISGLIAFIIIVGLNFNGLMGRLENLTGDVLRRKLAVDFVSPIEIVFLDDVSLKTAETKFGVTYPWPRETYGTAVKFFKRAGAKAVVFDFLFTSKSPLGMEDDKALADAAFKHGQVFAGLQVVSAPQPDAIARIEGQQDIYSVMVGREGANIYKGHGVDAPYYPLWGGFTGLGDVNFQQDIDSLNRRARLLSGLNDKIYPSLALAAAWHLNGKPSLSLKDHILEMGTKSYFLDEDDMLNILFRNPAPRNQSTSLIEIISSEMALADGKKPLIDPARFKGKIVMIGSDAPGLLDLRPHPLNKRGPGVELQAMVLDNLLSGESLRVIPMNALLWGILFLLCLATARFSWSFRGAVLIVPLALIAGLIALAIYDYQNHHAILPTATALSGVLLALATSSGENFFLERRQKSRVQSIFGQFLSPAVLKTLGTSVSELKTGGETKNLAVFFSDLAGFTSFSEKLTPDQLVVILNEYLEEMAEVVVGKHDGYVDKYIGDAIMAFWGAPTPHKNPALEAAICAWDCQVKLAEIQAHLATLGLDAGDEGLVMRIGINYGPCVVGLMGSSRKLNYTVMGDTVNTASRLEGANKPYGTRIMLSDSAREQCGDAVITRVLDYLKVKGKTEPTKVHHLIGLKGQGGILYESAYVELYHGALEQYRKGDFAKAKAIFEECLRAKPKDGVASLYRDRCVHFIEEPPEGIWDGVYTMKTK